MSDALSRILSSGVSLDEVRGFLDRGLSLEDVEAAVGRMQARGEKIGGEEEENGEVRPDDFSDVGNMETFSTLNAGRLLYTDSRGWQCWDGLRWVADDHQAHERAVLFSQAMLNDARERYRTALHAQAEARVQEDEESLERFTAAVKAEKAYLDHANRTRAERRIKAILELAKHRFAIDPARLDANPAELNTPKGIVNLVTGEVRPCDRSALCTKVTACAPGSMGMKMWIDFLKTITEEDGPLMGFLQQMAGMALFGKVYHEGIVLAYGGGRNGKSTLFNALAAVLGDYAGTLDISVLTTDRQNRGAALATLRGKRLVIAGELEEGKRLSVFTLKQISSTDPMTIEEKYRAPETVIPSHTLVLYTNHLPRVGSTDEGTWRRLTVAPFNARITGGTPNYAAKLVDEAGPAIMAWALQGAMLFAQNGYTLQIPDIVAELTEEYREREDWLSNFLQECCTLAPDARAPAGELYRMYREWAESSGDYVRRDVEFSSAMEGRGFQKIKPKNRKTWVGLKPNRAERYGFSVG